MKMIDKDRVLRLNCPGFGEESHLNIGRAKTLENYQVIIANPVSLLHLFDKGPEPTRRINQLMSEGVNQLNVPDDALIQELINESDARLEELIPFLSQGGLLIYFLCRPFVLAGPSISIDNYDWLSVYAPATKHPPENGHRQMSALASGRTIELTEEGEQSEMAEYFKQPGIEWNTIIRTDFLSSNYSVMATAGAKKGIAAQFWAGDNGGKVVFLPAPYSPDFDRTLMNCVNKWYQEAIRQGTIQESNSAIPVLAKEDPTFHKPSGPDFYNGEQLQTPATGSAAAPPTAAASPSAQTFAPPPLSSLLKFDSSDLSDEPQKAPAPKGALKSLLSSDLLDDDDEFTTTLPEMTRTQANDSAAATSATEPAPPAVKLTAEDILASVSQEASRLNQASANGQSAADSDSGQTVDAERPKLVEPETAQVKNFELKKATAEMDLSQFAQTARQLVEQANVIESATRDPLKDQTKDQSKETSKPPAPPSVPIPVSAAKQRIADLLKGLEFGRDAEDSDELEPAPAAKGEDLIDVESLDHSSDKASNLAADLKPNRESISRNWLGAHSQDTAAPAVPASSNMDLSPVDVSAVQKSNSSSKDPDPSADISAMTNEEFRNTFEFLRGDDQGAVLSDPTDSSEIAVPEDKKSLMAQAGLSADSLMNELSVMNELNALMQESQVQAAQPPAKEEPPVQSLSEEEIKEEKSDDEANQWQDAGKQQSLRSLMEALGQTDPRALPTTEKAARPSTALGQESAAEPVQAPVQPSPVAFAPVLQTQMTQTSDPQPKMQTSDNSFEELIQAAVRFDGTKTAESVPSLKLAHEEMSNQEKSAILAAERAAFGPPESPSAPAQAGSEPLTTSSSEMSWAPKDTPMPMAPASTDSISGSDFEDALAAIEASEFDGLSTGANIDSVASSTTLDAVPASPSVSSPSPSVSSPSPIITPPPPAPAPATPVDAWAASSEKALSEKALNDLSGAATAHAQLQSSSSTPGHSAAQEPLWMASTTQAASSSAPESIGSTQSANNEDLQKASPTVSQTAPTPADVSSAWAQSAAALVPTEKTAAAQLAAPAFPAEPAVATPPAPLTQPASKNDSPVPAILASLAYEHPAHPHPHPPVAPLAPAQATTNNLDEAEMATQSASQTEPLSPASAPAISQAAITPPASSIPSTYSTSSTFSTSSQPTFEPAPSPPQTPVEPASHSANQSLTKGLDLNAVTPPLPTTESPSPSNKAASQIDHPATTNGDGDKSDLNHQSLQQTASSDALSALEPITTPQPEELIKKMQQLTSTSAPSWCTDFSFPFIDGLRKEHAQLAEQVRQLQSAMNGMEARLETVETLKMALLIGEQEAFLSASQEILTRVGWQVQASRNDPNELWLVRGERVEAIARVVRSSSGANRSDLAQLAQSVIAFWDKYETEPKGLLLAQNFANQHPSERTEPDFGAPLVDAAAKKSLCLMSSFQLLAMFKDGELGQMTADEMRKRILETNGKLAGFALDNAVAQPATV